MLALRSFAWIILAFAIGFLNAHAAEKDKKRDNASQEVEILVCHGVPKIEIFESVPGTGQIAGGIEMLSTRKKAVGLIEELVLRAVIEPHRKPKREELRIRGWSRIQTQRNGSIEEVEIDLGQGAQPYTYHTSVEGYEARWLNSGRTLGSARFKNGREIGDLRLVSMKRIAYIADEPLYPKSVAMLEFQRDGRLSQEIWLAANCESRNQELIARYVLDLGDR